MLSEFISNIQLEIKTRRLTISIKVKGYPPISLIFTEIDGFGDEQIIHFIPLGKEWTQEQIWDETICFLDMKQLEQV